MLPAFADLDQLAARKPGGITDEDLPRAQTALNDASTEIRVCAGKTWVTSEGALDLPTGDDAWRADVLVKVCCSSAMRALDNPEAYSQQTIGSYSEARANPSLDVYLTSSERRDVLRAAAKTGLSTISTTRSDIVNGRPLGLETAGVCDDNRPDRNSEGTTFADVAGGEPVPWIDLDGY